MSGSYSDGAGAVGAELAGGIEGEMSRRGLLAAGLAGVASVPLLSGLRGLEGAFAGNGTVPPADGSALAGGMSGPIERGGVRRFNAPWLTPGARLRLPDGVKATAAEGYFANRTRITPRAYAWPHLPAADGTMVDASIVPERGAPPVMAVLTGFRHGRYELVHANGRRERVDWNARKFPYLWFWGEFGATKDLPFRGQFFTVGLEPFSHNPIR